MCIGIVILSTQRTIAGSVGLQDPHTRESGWQRDPPIRDAGYEPSNKDSYIFGSLLYIYLVAAIYYLSLNLLAIIDINL